MTNRELDNAVDPTLMFEVYSSFMDFKAQNFGDIDATETAEVTGVVKNGVWLSLELNHGMLDRAVITHGDTTFDGSEKLTITDEFDFTDPEKCTVTSFSKSKEKIHAVYKNRSAITKYDVSSLTDCLRDMRVLNIGTIRESEQATQLAEKPHRFRGLLMKVGIIRQ